jgi:hypothetical protein
MSNRKQHPFNQMVAEGNITDHTFIHKFGAVPALSTNNTGSVWDINDTVYPWSAFDTAGVVNLDRANTSDANKVVTVIGLDADYNETQESITLTDASNNTGTVVFKRVFRAFVADGTTNVGNIDIQRASTTVARITATKGQTLMAVYTVPAGYTGYLYKGTASAQSGADATGNMFVRFFGQQSFRTQHTFEVGGTGGQYTYEFTFPPPIPEKSDIDVQVSGRTNNGRYTAAFDLLLIEN